MLLEHKQQAPSLGFNMHRNSILTGHACRTPACIRRVIRNSAGGETRQRRCGAAASAQQSIVNCGINQLLLGLIRLCTVCLRMIRRSAQALQLLSRKTHLQPLPHCRVRHCRCRRARCRPRRPPLQSRPRPTRHRPCRRRCCRHRGRRRCGRKGSPALPPAGNPQPVDQPDRSTKHSGCALEKTGLTLHLGCLKKAATQEGRLRVHQRAPWKHKTAQSDEMSPNTVPSLGEPIVTPQQQAIGLHWNGPDLLQHTRNRTCLPGARKMLDSDCTPLYRIQACRMPSEEADAQALHPPLCRRRSLGNQVLRHTRFRTFLEDPAVNCGLKGQSGS